MLRNKTIRLIQTAVQKLISEGALPEAVSDVAVEVLDTKSPEHGDYACNFALVSSKKAGQPPRKIGETLRDALLANAPDVFAAIDIAGPGFLNMKLKPEVIAAYIPTILQHGAALATAGVPEGAKRRINVEFVSVNPNGPITVGSGRGAAFGDTLSRVFRAAGVAVSPEYYINDGVNSEQMRLFAESVRHYYRTALGQESTFPEKGYRGEYVVEVAIDVQKKYGDSKIDEPTSWFQKVSQELMIERQRSDLALFGVKFDTWFSEQSLHNGGKVQAALEKLEKAGNAYRAVKPADLQTEDDEEETTEGGEALWLKSTEFGDDKDRVLVRADGRPAYIAADVAYLDNKLGDRAFDKAYMVLGPDHHGYIGRMNAVCQALGYPLEKFEVIIFQIVRFLKDGKPAPMRKRDGNIYELKDLILELGAAVAPNDSLEEQARIGRDVSRFFYLMRSHDTHMDFDIDLATKQSDENPVFYVQYAHARICSVIAKASEAGLHAEGYDFNQLQHAREMALIKKILDLPFEVQRCAKDHGVHRLTTYAIELARTYHHFYDACRVVQTDQPELSKARIALCQAARLGLQSTLDLLGVSAPERMNRATVE